MPLLAVVIGRGTYSAFQIKSFFEDSAALVWVGDSGDLPLESPPALLSRMGRFLDTHDLEVSEVARELVSSGARGVIAFADPQLPLAAKLAEIAGLAYHSTDVVALLTDKVRQRAALSRAGIWVPQFCPLDLAPGTSSTREVDGNIEGSHLPSFPAVLKPRSGTNSSDTYLVCNEGELAELSSEIASGNQAGRYILEAFIGDRIAIPEDAPQADYLSVESFADGDTVNHIGITGRFPTSPPFRGSGGFFPADLDPDLERDVYRLTELSLAALGVRTGICHTEIKLTADGPRLLEVNGRMGGDTEVLVRLSTGNSIVPYLVSNMMSGRSGAGSSDFVPKRVAFRIAVQPPIWARRLEGITGLDRAAALPGVDGVALNKSVGTELDYREGAMSQIYSVSGWADDHEKMLALRQRVLDSVEMEFS